SPQRLVAAGFGGFQPIDTDKTEEAFGRNRRLELKLTERGGRARVPAERAYSIGHDGQLVLHASPLYAPRRGRGDRILARHLAARLSPDRFQRPRRLVAPALAR